MSEEENKEIIRRFYEAHNTGDVAMIRAVVGPTWTTHSPGGKVVEYDDGPEARAQNFAGLKRRFPDLHYNIEDLLSEGDRVVVRSTTTGTAVTDWVMQWGVTIRPTGKPATWTMICIYRLVEGRIVEYWWEMDWVNFLLQMGIVPGKTVV